MNNTSRNESIDILRGLAALMVVFFHTLQRFPHASDNLLFHLCFSVQIPLFILISGYSTSFSQPITNLAFLWKHFKKRLLMLLLPWAVWSLISYWLFHSGISLSEYAKATAYHMESAYWFLFTLWVIDIIHGLASLLSNRIKISYNILIYSMLYSIGGGVLVIIGYKFGMTFLGTQYTLYYMPFFYIGYLAGHYKNTRLLRNDKIWTLIWGILCVVYFLIVPKYGYTDIPYTSYYLFVRTGLSLAGCFCIIGLAKKIQWNKMAKLKSCLLWAGNYSLEIYVIHLVVLHYLQKSNFEADTVEGLFICIFKFCVVYLITVLLVKMLHSNKYTSKLLFGKE